MVVAAALLVLLGAVVRGYTGFGASMFWVASLSLLLAPSTAVPVVLALEVLSSLVMLPGVWGDVSWRPIGWLLLGSVLLTPVGVLLLEVVPERTMRGAIGLGIVVGVALLASGARRRGPAGRRISLLTGGVAGITNGAAAIGGVPAALLMFSGEETVRIGRASLIAYFLAMDTFALLVLGTRGLVGGRTAMLTLWFAPVAALGILVGQRVYARRGDEGFRAVALGILAVIGLATVVRAALVG